MIALACASRAVTSDAQAGDYCDNRALAVEIASLPDRIRGFGHIKAEAIQEAKAREAELMAAFRANEPIPSAAE